MKCCDKYQTDQNKVLDDCYHMTFALILDNELQ